MAEEFSLLCSYHQRWGSLDFSQQELLVSFRCLSPFRVYAGVPNKELLDNSQVYDWPLRVEVRVPDGEFYARNRKAQCIVRRGDVRHLELNFGLVSVLMQGIDKDEKKATVGIPKIPDGKVNSFIVPLEDVPYAYKLRI